MFILVLLLALILAGIISSMAAGLAFVFVYFVMKKQVTKRFLIISGIVGLALFLIIMMMLNLSVV